VAATFFDSSRPLTIGNDGNLNRGFIGQLDDVRITKGVARYAGAFTPPTGPFLDVVGEAPGAGAGGVTAHHVSRRRIMQMVNDNPRLARKLGIRGKLQILE